MSSAAGTPGQDVLDAILSQSRRNNAADDITGALLYNDGNFFQVLEGPAPAVQACFARIERDRRHKGCIILRSEALGTRNFATWDMAFIPFGRLGPDEQNGFINLKTLRDQEKMDELRRDRSTGHFVNAFLSSFRNLKFA